MTDYELLEIDRIAKIQSINKQYDLENNAYLSFSGGKDSTVLHYLLDLALPGNKIPRLFINTGIEYEYIVDFVKKLEQKDSRIQIVNSNVNIKKMLEIEGYPFKSKEHSLKLGEWQKGSIAKSNIYYKEMSGKSRYACPKKLLYQYERNFKLRLSDKCCYRLKKDISHKWEKENNKNILLTGMLKEEGGQRSSINCIVTDKKNNLKKFHPLAVVTKSFENWFIETHNIKLCKLYYPPFNFERTGCKGCPFALDLQNQLDVMERLLPAEKAQCEKLWAPVYEEYRRINFRLKNQTTIFDFISTKLKVLELFGGIGACTAALKRLGIDFEVADYVEIDKYAVASYNAINKTNFEPQDITKWDKDIEVDLIMSGSSCQDFSLAGLGKGGDKGSGTRSSLMYENIRIIEKLKPKYVILENVKNLLSKKHIHNFNAYLEAMEELGYYSYYQVLNAKDYGIPQNRERVFTVSIRKDINKLFTFPPKQEFKLKLKDLLEDEVDEKYYLSGEQIARIVDIEGLVSTVIENHGTVTAILEGDTNRTICLNSKSGRNGIDGLQPSRKDRIYSSDGIACTIATNDFYNPNYLVSLILAYKIRKLTPKECWRLMGFNDEDFEKAAKVNSKTQLYKQAGNSIVVNVLMAIFNNLV